MAIHFAILAPPLVVTKCIVTITVKNKAIFMFCSFAPLPYFFVAGKSTKKDKY